MVHTYWLLGRKERRPKRRLPRIDEQSVSDESTVAECPSNARSESVGDVSPGAVSDVNTRRSPSHSEDVKAGQGEDPKYDVNATREAHTKERICERKVDEEQQISKT